MKMLLALIVAVAALIMPTAPARADIQTVYYNGTFGAAGTQQWFALSGQSQCALTLSGSGTGMSITVQGASDQPPATPTTLTAIGTAGVVTTNGTYSGAVAGSALTGIRLNVTAITGGAGIYQIVCSPAGTGFSPTSPLPALSGGVGPNLMPAPPPGATGFFEGDSIILGSTGSTSCSLTYAVLVTSITGNCMADLIANHWGLKELGYPVLGTCVVLTATDSNGLCNKPSTTVGSLISRYQSDFTHLTTGMYFFWMQGTNDVFSWSNGNTLVNAATFKANLTTIMTAAATAVGDPKKVTMIEIPHMPTAFSFYEDIIDSIIDDVAFTGGYNLATTATAIQQCAIVNPTTDSCTFDATHPDVAGYAAMANGVFAANYVNAIGAGNAARAAMKQDFALNSSTNVILGGRATAYLSYGTVAQNNVCGGYSGCALLTTGSSNTVIGAFAGNSITTSSNNTFLGQQAGQSTAGQGNVCIGFSACSAGGALNFNTIIGSQSVASSAVDSFEIVIGQGITGIGSNSVKICSGSAPCFTSGTGAPAGTAPNGSIYMRYDGTTGTRMYVWQCTASTSCATPVAVAGF